MENIEKGETKLNKNISIVINNKISETFSTPDNKN